MGVIKVSRGVVEVYGVIEIFGILVNLKLMKPLLCRDMVDETLIVSNSLSYSGEGDFSVLMN